MKIAVTGGRHHRPTREEVRRFRAIWRELGGKMLLVGDCPTGVDRWAVQAAIRHSIHVRVYCASDAPTATALLVPIDQRVHCSDWRRDGRSAGPIRNGRMVADAEATIGFPGNTGTANCLRQARALGRICRLVSDLEGALESGGLA